MLKILMQTMRFTRIFSRLNLIYALFIIAWGAWVRLSGSGAGCGEHWPLCDGEVIPTEAGIQKIIEFTHRVTSGFFGVTILAQFFFSFKESVKGDAIRLWSGVSLALTLVESLIGAFLVKKGLVADNDSTLRALVISFHLVNTFFLIGALTAADFFSRKHHSRDKEWSMREKLFWFASFFLLLLVGASGSIAALGNTLFPVTTLADGIRADLDSTSHFLIQLRIYHPILAVLTSFILISETLNWKEKGLSCIREGRTFLIVLSVHLAFGALNWMLLAPAWGAITHLLLADLVFIIFVRLGLSRSYIESVSN